MVELEYTYTEQPSGWLVGRLKLYPHCTTQGKDLAELEYMLSDVYKLMKEEEAEQAELERQEKARWHTGTIRIDAEVTA